MPRRSHALPFLATSLALLLLLLVLQPATVNARGDDEEPAPAPAEPKARVPAPKGPGGMVYVPGGRAVIGSGNKQIIDLTRGRPADVLQMFILETPRHQPLIPGYFIDRHEVTNAQYHSFLVATASTVYDTTSGTLGNLDEVAASLLGLSDAERGDRRIRYWAQLYFANREALWAGFAKFPGKEDGKTKLDELKVLLADGECDQERTAAKFRFEALPREISLAFYNRRPPSTWKAATPPDGRWNHPVRDISYLDCQRFAEWAGKHVPSEREWEYAARGPQGLQFPWGNDLPTEKQAARARGNWGANYIDQRTYRETSVAVDEIPGGKSWCGAYHLVGNVAEWTSSWFKAYPGYRRDSKWNRRLGETIKVVHGAHAGSREILVLRPAARNFVGSGPKAPPYPGNRFEWVGFRCAYYPAAGQNHREPIITRLIRGRRVLESRLATENFVGSVIENFAESESWNENHVYVLGESKAILVIPARKILFESGDDWVKQSWTKARRWKKTKDFAKRSTETGTPRIILGALHTDIGLDKVWLKKPLTEEEKAKARKGRSGRGRKRAPETVPGTLEPGSYVLTLWHGRLALANESLEFECFLSTAKDTLVEVVKKIDPANPPVPAWELDSLADEAKFEFHVQLGGKKMDEGIYVKVSGLLRYELGSLDTAGEWRSGGGTDLPDHDVCEMDLSVPGAPAPAAGEDKPEPDKDAEPEQAPEPAPEAGAGDAKDDEKQPEPAKPDDKQPADKPPEEKKPEEKPGGDGDK